MARPKCKVNPNTGNTQGRVVGFSAEPSRNALVLKVPLLRPRRLSSQYQLACYRVTADAVWPS